MESNNNNNNNNMIIVDITVSNLKIVAAKPEIQTLMPNSDTGKIMFWNVMPLERVNKRVYGRLKGKALQKAAKVVNKNGDINISGEYGSIEIDEKDFIPYEKERSRRKGDR